MTYVYCYVGSISPTKAKDAPATHTTSIKSVSLCYHASYKLNAPLPARLNQKLLPSPSLFSTRSASTSDPNKPM